MASVDAPPGSAPQPPPQSAGEDSQRLVPPTRQTTRQFTREGTGSLSSSLLAPASASRPRERTLGQLPPLLIEEGAEGDSPIGPRRDVAVRSVSSVSSTGSMIGFPDEQEFQRRLEAVREDMAKSLQKSVQWRQDFQQRSQTLVHRVRLLAQGRRKREQPSTTRPEVQGPLTPDGSEELSDALPSERVVEGGDFTPDAIT